MTVHDLKCSPDYFDDVRCGRKTFEVRLNDRNFQIGDQLRLRKFEAPYGYYWDLPVLVWITYILDDYQGLAPGYVVLGIVPGATPRAGLEVTP